MTWLWLFPGVFGLALLGLLLYWQLIIAEGAYLGRRVVTALYDWSAHIYERIKQYDVGAEQWYLGMPLTAALELIEEPLVLDVGTGTGRLPRAVLRQPGFDGSVIGLDLSRRMLREATRQTAQFADRLTYVWQDAQSLPFDDDTFDAVTCLEALEFVPRPTEALKELVRVLRPGGVLLVTNRVGPQARLLPRRAFRRADFERLLARLPLEDIQPRVWQVEYDFIWAVKTGRPRGGGVRPLTEVLRCPACRGQLQDSRRGLRCGACGRAFRIGDDGVVELARTETVQPAEPAAS